MRLYGLQKALYVYNMNQHQPKTKPKTMNRLESNVVEACREIVNQHDQMERYKEVLRQRLMVPTI